MMRLGFRLVFGLVAVFVATAPPAGEPQVRTDHPWFPGELSCSTFARLFATQAALYERVTGRKTDNDEDEALASWYGGTPLFEPEEPACAGVERPGMCPRGEAVRDH